MEILAKNSVNFREIYCAINDFKMVNTEKLLSKIIDEIYDNENLKYIGELNKNDLMF